MLRLKLQDFATEAGVGEKNTVSNGQDSGANNQMAALFWNCMRHGTTSQAVDVGVSMVPFAASAGSPQTTSAGGMNIGGHGNEGLLETGMGQTGPYDVEKFMSLYNEYSWGPQLDRIRPTPITLISIWSCHTGAGQDGADFLFDVAVRCGRAVRARTGFTYVNSQQIWFEANSVWQVATPANRPAPIQAPTPHFIPGAVAQIEVAGMDMEPDQVTKLVIERVDFKNVRSAVKSATDGAAAIVAKALFLPGAMEMDVEVMGFITATITLTFKGGTTATFDVYNDRLAIERGSKTGYYLKGQLSKLYEML